MKKDENLVIDATEKLRRNYLDVLRRRVIELRNFSKRCDEGQLTTEEFDDIHLRVRSLVGSGATYGYPNVSAAADPLDQALGSPTIIGLKMLAGLADNLAGECTKCINAFEHENSFIFKQPTTNAKVPKPVLLTIDDDPAIHDLVDAMFGSSAHTVAAYSSDEALQAINRHCPNLILMDNYMPGMDGIKLLQNIGSRDFPAVPVIMLTADARPHEIMRATAAGAADYITKPFEPQNLSEKIRDFIERMSITVLIANGDPVMRELMANRLRRQGLNVIEAANGNETIILAANHVPELILLDQSSSNMGDRETLHTLRVNKRTRHIPMLYLTTDGQGQSTLESINTGIGDAASMPFAPEKITARVMETLGLETQ